MATKPTKKFTPEEVGRKYSVESWAFMSRLVGGDGKWYGRDNFRTEEEARAALDRASSGSRYQIVGGIAMDFGPSDGERYERKLVKVTKHCGVVEVRVSA